MRKINANWYRYKYAAFDNWNLERLMKPPKARTSRKLEAIAKCIEKCVDSDDKRLAKWKGGKWGRYHIKTTDGFRALLVKGGDSDAIELPYELPNGEHSIMVSDPDFYLALKRMLILANDASKRVTFRIQGNRLTLKATSSEGEAEEEMEVDSNGDSDAEFSVNGKLLLECLGNWPVIISYEPEKKTCPILFEFSEFAYVASQLVAK